jgi:hypothetical protein
VASCCPSLLMLQAAEQQSRDAWLSMWSDQPLISASAEPGLGTMARAPVRPAVRLWLASEQAAVLALHIPALAETVREITSRHQPGQVMLDLSELAPGPFYQELACLCTGLRRILGPGIPIVLDQVNPAVAWSLESGYLPEGVTVVPIRVHPHRANAADAAGGAEETISAWCACGRTIRLRTAVAAQQLVICGLCATCLRTGSSHGLHDLTGGAGNGERGAGTAGHGGRLRGSPAPKHSRPEPRSKHGPARWWRAGGPQTPGIPVREEPAWAGESGGHTRPLAGVALRVLIPPGHADLESVITGGPWDRPTC